MLGKLRAVLQVLACALLVPLSASALGQRKPVLPQVDLPHSYYWREMYLPQLTSGPDGAAWSPDGQWLVYAMQGFLWRQRVDGSAAEELTDSDGTDHQPDWSPDGRHVVFVRYDGRAMELMLLDVGSFAVTPLTSDGAVNVEPRWSPDGTRLAWVSTRGTGHFLLHTASVRAGGLVDVRPLVPDRRSAVPRYYYSPFDHAIHPAWTPDGKSLVFVSNREVAHGTGDIVRMAADGSGSMEVLRREETNWQARPDVSPDGTRFVYASYLGGQWHQLWLLPLGGPGAGAYPLPLTYGDFDNTAPRWSPDGRRIAFVSNRTGNVSLWLVDAVSGEQMQVVPRERRWLAARRLLTVKVRDEAGRPLPARLSVTDARGRFFAPDDAWIHANDLILPDRERFEPRYVHGSGEFRLMVPPGPLDVKVARGPEYAIVRRKVDGQSSVTVTLPRLKLPGKWWSGDLHVHMNYGGRYRNTPAHLVEQARAEGLDVVYDLVVNKEQRVPDIAAFQPGVDPASKNGVLLLHGQEFHSSYWGHIGLLGLQRLVLPGYNAYPLTAVASPWPHNAAVADMAHTQRGLVGYVHPFDSDVDPSKDEPLTNELVVDAALGKVDYYEAVGFSDHLSTAAVWYRLLDCGLRLPAGAGTDAMANYASLRGPVGMNRVYVKAQGSPSRESFLAGLKEGRTFATNGPLIGLRVGTSEPGDAVELPAAVTLEYKAWLRSNAPIARMELIWNGRVAERHDVNATSADLTGRIPATESGWMLLRAFSEEGNEDVLDIHPYATTSPIYVTVAGHPRRSRAAATWALQWLDRVWKATLGAQEYRTRDEREAVLRDISRASDFYSSCAADERARP
ncbi:MAG TPA: CehA/McbA family metallohydrolase [Myxococcales bacterium]|nr:CehA/McbA family metallohydrolase [Myxococcales bacterium]